MSRILVVDDKEMMRDSVSTTLARKGYTAISASGGKAALERIATRRPDVVVTDLQMPEMDGLELLDEIRRIDEQLPVIFMTAFGTVETAVKAMKQGAFDFVTKPFSGDELVVAVERALKQRKLERENQILRAATGVPGSAKRHELIGSSGSVRQLLDRLRCVADSHGAVFITGESGSGKEVAARWIHEHSRRAEQPFLAINCAALSTSLLESELFGHERGAFTGADRLRKGRFELADGGTLLLDEISEIGPSIQAKLLRVLQEQVFERVGSSRSLAVDVRVIATSNRDLAREVERGTFRQDLFYRLNVLPLTMPPLRDHPDDIDALVAHFLQQVAEREGKPVRTMEPAALDAMRRYAWPGNVRELQNVCERAAVLTQGDRVCASLIEPWLPNGRAAMPERQQQRVQRDHLDHLDHHDHHHDHADDVAHLDERANAAWPAPAPFPAGAAPSAGAPASSTIEAKPVPGFVCDGRVRLEDIERETIVATLLENNGHRQRSAKALGIGVRTLGLKLKKWKEQKLVEETL